MKKLKDLLKKTVNNIETTINIVLGGGGTVGSAGGKDAKRQRGKVSLRNVMLNLFQYLAIRCKVLNVKKYFPLLGEGLSEMVIRNIFLPLLGKDKRMGNPYPLTRFLIREVNDNSPKLTYSQSKHCAFTLSEVLITLGIIGVIAAMTIPTIMSKIEDRQNIAKWKKAYSTVNNAFNKVVIADGVPICEYRGPNTCIDDGSSYLYSKEFIQSMKKELNVVDTCASSMNTRNPLGFKKCGFDGDNFWNGFSGNDVRSKYSALGYKVSKLGAAGSINSYDIGNFAFLLVDGTSLNFGGLFSGLTIGVDVNSAAKGPNQLGRDFFLIRIFTKNYGEINYLKPFGAIETKGWNDPSSGSSGCSKDIGKSTTNEMYQAAGAGCSAKYLLE